MFIDDAPERNTPNHAAALRFVKDLEAVLKEQPYLTNAELSKMFRVSEQKVKSARGRIGIANGKGDVMFNLNPAERIVIDDICELLAYDINMTDAEITKRLGLDIEIVELAKLVISMSDIEATRERLKAANNGIFVYVPKFIPKKFKVKCNDGVERVCLNEFVGIVENGGLCYNDYHYEIPKGMEDPIRRMRHYDTLKDLACPMD